MCVAITTDSNDPLKFRFSGWGRTNESNTAKPPTPPFGRLALDIAWREMSEPAVSHWTGSRVLKMCLKHLQIPIFSDGLTQLVVPAIQQHHQLTSTAWAGRPSPCVTLGNCFDLFKGTQLTDVVETLGSALPHALIPPSTYICVSSRIEQRIRHVLQVDCVPTVFFHDVLYSYINGCFMWCCLISTDTKHQMQGFCLAA